MTARKKRRTDAIAAERPLVTWPSGEGAEFGVVDLPLEAIARLTGKSIVEDDGVLAVIYDSGPKMPVTFIVEPEVGGDLVAVIADSAAERERLHERVETLLGGPLVQWHGALGAPA